MARRRSYYEDDARSSIELLETGAKANRLSWLDVVWDYTEQAPLGLLTGFEVVILIGTDPDDPETYVRAPEIVAADVRRYTVSVAFSTDVSNARAAVRAIYGGAKSAWTLQGVGQLLSANQLELGTLQNVLDAHNAAIAAQADADDSLTQLSDISADNKLTPSEKIEANREYNQIINEQAGILTRADGFGITTERDTYAQAVVNLTNYLQGLSPTWNATNATTDIVRATWNWQWQDVYLRRQQVLNKITERAGAIAEWAGVTGPGRPEDNATYGASPAQVQAIVSSGGTYASKLAAFSGTFAGEYVPSFDGASYGVSAGSIGVNVTGGASLHTAQAVQVDTSRKYLVRCAVEQLIDSAAGQGQVFVGVATLDENYDALTSGPGSHRYCAAIAYELTVAQGIKVFEGIVTGEGDTSYNEFRPGTKYARPVVLTNYAGGTGTARVHWLSIVDVTDAEVAKGSAAAAQSDATAALGSLSDISADNKLTPNEKIEANREYNQIINEQSGILTRADGFGITTERDTYAQAVVNLTNYLQGLSPTWNATNATTDIARATWNSYWQDVYLRRQQVLNRIAELAGTVADWGGVTGAGKPENYATWGATSGNLQVGTGVNMLTNPHFRYDNGGWAFQQYNGATDWYFGRNGPGTGWNIDPATAHVHSPTAGSSFYATVVHSEKISVVAGRRYEGYMYTGAHRCVLHVCGRWTDSAGNTVGWITFGSNDEEAAGGTDLSGYKQTGGFGVAPAGATRLEFYLQKNGTKDGQADSWAFFTRAYFGEAYTNQQEFSPWTEGRGSVDNRVINGIGEFGDFIGANMGGTPTTHITKLLNPYANMLRNPTGEKGQSYWAFDPGTSAVDSSQWGEGYLFRFGGFSSGGSYQRLMFSELRPVQPGVVLSLSADMYGAGISAGGLIVDLYIYSDAGATTIGAYGGIYAANGQSWKRQSSVITVPAGAAYFRVLVHYLPNTVVSFSQIRRIMINEGSIPAPFVDTLGSERDLRNMAMLSSSQASLPVNPSYMSSSDLGTTAGISIGAHSVNFGGFTVNYSAGSVTGLAFSTKYYVYCDDPDFKGGAVTYYATTNFAVLAQGNGRRGVGTLTTAADGGSTTVPDDPWCVDYDTLLPDGRLVRSLQPGDLVECIDVATGERGYYPLLAMGVGYAECYALQTPEGAEIWQSESTPMDMPIGPPVRTPDMLGQPVYILQDGVARLSVVSGLQALGRRRVLKPDFGNRMFFAGCSAGISIATHNLQHKP